MEVEKTLQLYQKPICTSFGFIVKRKLCGAFIPFAVMFAAHIPVQMLLFWMTAIETPFLSAPLFMLLFFLFCSPVFSHRIEDKYGVTRTKSFLTSYIVAAIYSLIMTFFALGLAVLCNYIEYSKGWDINLLMRRSEVAVNFFYGFITCLLMYSLSDIFSLFGRSKHLLAIVVSTVLMLGIPLVCTGMTGQWGDVLTFPDCRVYAFLTYLICFVVMGFIDYILVRGGILK